MDLRKQIKDIDVNITNKCRQYEELKVESSVSEKGVTRLAENISVSRDVAKTKRNNNILVFDDKERNYEMVLANLREDESNYIIVDFDGEYYRDTAPDFKADGYQIKCINLMDTQSSDGYNPFAFIQNEVDVDTIVQCILCNTSSSYYFKTPGKERLLVKSLEQTFLKLLLSTYMKYGTAKTLTATGNLLRGEAREEKLEKLFSGKYEQGPKEMECKRFHLFKQDAGERYVDILDSCSERIDAFRDERMVQLTKKESVNLNQLYQGKQVLFIILPSTMREVELFTSILLSQILYTLCNESRRNNHDRMVMLCLNYFADSGVIANLDRLLPELQHYNVGCMIHVNNFARVGQVYPKWEEMFASFDTILYLGSSDDATQKYLLRIADTLMIRKTKVIGKEVYKTSALKQEEIKNMDNDSCILVIKGFGTFLTRRIGAR